MSLPQQLHFDLSKHFNDDFLSDFQLRLVSPDKAELSRFKVHGIVLAGQSAYFKSLIRNWMDQDTRVLDITVTEDELPAAQQMLVCAYANSIPKDADADQALATMVLADRYQLRVCVEACKAHLLGLDSSSISWSTALTMLRLPPGLREGEAFAALTEKAHERVWETFQDLDEAWANRAARQQWLQLPAEAVERVLNSKELQAASENVIYVVVASWLVTALKQAASDPHQLQQIQQFARLLLTTMRYSHMTGNFLAVVATHHGLLSSQPEVARWLLEAMQWSKAAEAQRSEMQACASHVRFSRRVGRPTDGSSSSSSGSGISAFTSYIAQADLQQAINKYRASNCTEAYYLLTGGHFYNGFTWRLKLTVKPPDAGSAHDMNIHVGLCWGIEVEGEGALSLSESAMVQVDFDIATWDFVLHEEDPTSSAGPVVIKAGTCWGWDDFFGPEVYSDPGLWGKFMTAKNQLLLSCHLYSCQ